MDQVKIDKLVFGEAEKYLLKNTPKSVTKDIISQYHSITEVKNKIHTMNDVFYGLIDSAQNSNMKSTVVGDSIGGVSNLSEVLFKFDPKDTLNAFSGRPELLLQKIKEELKPTGKIRETNRSIWPQYCKTILSGALFLNQFSSLDEFQTWVKCFYNNENTLPALPMLISAEVHGLGFPLACDFLKDLGYSKFGKPDIHIKQIFEATSLTTSTPSDYQTLKSILRVAANVDQEAYVVDKIFWLIGSGKFYLHPHIGKQGKVRQMKKEFIEHISKIIL